MSKGTTMRYIRIDDGLWLPVKDQCAAEGINVSELVRGMLRGWLENVGNDRNEGEK